MSITCYESPELLACEEIIHRGKATFIEVGTALCRIRDERLYLAKGFSSFSEYCEQVWDWGKSYASRMIQAADIAAKLPIGNESHARELAKVPEEQRADVLAKAAEAGPVTARAIREAAKTTADEAAGAPMSSDPPEVRTLDDEFRAAMGRSEPRVTEYYERLEALVNDALENATDKQLVSMSVYAKAIPAIIKSKLAERKSK